MTIAMLHYSFAPVVGGVESVIRQQAEVLAGHGHRVIVIFGEGGGVTISAGIEQHRLPLMSASHPRVLKAQAELADSGRSDDLEPLAAELQGALEVLLRECDLVIAHNLWVMPFHLTLTSVLWRLVEQHAAVSSPATPEPRPRRWISWVHDLAAARPDLPSHNDPRHPANLLCRHHHAVEFVAISNLRREQVTSLLGVAPERCRVVPNGIDEAAFLPPLQADLAALARRDRWIQRDLVLLQPARLVPRKNIEFGIEVAAALRDAGVDFRYLITAAADPHRSSTPSPYAEQLRELVRDRDLTGRVLFLSDTAAVGDADLAALYAYADALFLPSREEGFGLPLLEAAVARLPVFCTNLSPSLDILPSGGHFFKLSDNPRQVARSLLSIMQSWPQFNIRKSVVRRYNWHHIYQQHLKPLLLSA